MDHQIIIQKSASQNRKIDLSQVLMDMLEAIAMEISNVIKDKNANRKKMLSEIRAFLAGFADCPVKFLPQFWQNLELYGLDC